MLVADASNGTAAAGTLVLAVVTGIALWQTRAHARRALQPHVVPRLHADEPGAGRTVALISDGQGLARNARVALRLPGDGGQVVRSTFASLAPGDRGRFVRVSDSDPAMLRYLADHGIAPGAAFEVIDRQPFGGPLFVRFDAEQCDVRPLGGELAHAMRVELEGGCSR